jgi:hypothetical protein
MNMLQRWAGVGTALAVAGTLAFALLLVSAAAARAQQPVRVAILPLQAFSAEPVPTDDMARRLVEKATASGGYTGVFVRSRRGACADPECAVDAAKSVGATAAVYGRVTELDAQHWVLTATMISVPDGAVLRSIDVAEAGIPSVAFVDAVGFFAPVIVSNPIAPATPAVVANPNDEAQYRKDLSSWRKKWLWGLAIAAVFAGGAEANAQQVTTDNNKQKALASQASQATSLSQFNSLESQISSQKKNAQEHADMSNDFALVATVAAVYGGYQLFFNKPHAPPTQVSFDILPVPTPGGMFLALSFDF